MTRSADGIPLSPYPLFTVAIVLLGLSVVLSVYAALGFWQRAALQDENTVLRDERRTLDQQLNQLRREYLDKETALRQREQALSATEQERLTEELARLRREQRRVELTGLAESLQADLRRAANNPNIEVVSEADRFVIRLPESVVFNPNETTVSRPGESLLALLQPHWAGPWQGTLTQIEVHADGTPPPQTMRSRFPSNWEWTAVRAGAVARTLETLDPLAAPSFRAVGRGQAEAERDNPPPAGRRRVDVIVLFP